MRNNADIQNMGPRDDPQAIPLRVLPGNLRADGGRAHGTHTRAPRFRSCSHVGTRHGHSRPPRDGPDVGAMLRIRTLNGADTNPTKVYIDSL